MTPDPAESPLSPSTWSWAPDAFAVRVLDSATEGIVVYDRELRYRFWNRVMTDRIGIQSAEVYGRVCYEVFPHILQRGVLPYLERALAGETVQTPDYRYESPFNASEGWAISRYEPLLDAEGAIVGVVAHHHDVTSRRRAVAALQQSEERFRTIIESASDVVTILDAQGTVQYVSPALTAMLGWRAEQVVGRTPFGRVHPDDHAAVLEAIAAVARPSGETRRLQYRAQHADGSWRTLLSSGRNLLDDPSVHGIVVTTRDVTEWVELQARLHQSQRIEAVGRLAGGVAHDFNNLLTVIRGNAQLVLAAGSLPPDVQSEVEEIAQAADRAATLTRQLLAFSRQQVLQPRVLDLNASVRGIWSLLQRLVGETATLVLSAGESLGPVTADPVQVEQVLINLVVNARDAMPNGGRLEIETGNVSADADFARLHHPMPAGEYVRLVVRDTGIGMSETTMARVFDPFFTTKELGHGSGMGLSTVYGIVKQSGGYIWLESEEGRGSTFTIHLPLSAGSVGDATPHGTSPGERRGSETILIAEDEYLVRAMTRRTLERAGYRVFEAVNGVEALATARELGDTLDLLLTDIVMPEMGGRELAAKLRLERPTLAILFMSGYTHEREAHLNAGGGISNFLHKPFTLDELRGRVRLLLDQAPTTA